MLSKVFKGLIGVVLAIFAIFVVTFFVLKYKHRDTLPTVVDFDINKYVGGWNEVARLPHKHEVNCLYPVVASYTPESNGDVKVQNTCADKSGKMHVISGVARASGSTPGLFTVEFPNIGPFHTMFGPNYKVVAVGPVEENLYTMALVVSPGKKYAWILGRKAHSHDDDVMQQMLDKAKEIGLDTSRFVFPLDEAKKSGIFAPVVLASSPQAQAAASTVAQPVV